MRNYRKIRIEFLNFNKKIIHIINSAIKVKKDVKVQVSAIL